MQGWHLLEPSQHSPERRDRAGTHPQGEVTVGRSRDTRNLGVRNLPGRRWDFCSVFCVTLLHRALTRGFETLNYSNLLSPPSLHFSGKTLPKGISEQGQGSVCATGSTNGGFQSGNVLISIRIPAMDPHRIHCFYHQPFTPQGLRFCPVQRCPHSFPCQQSFPRLSHLGCCQSKNILLLMKNKTSTHGLLAFAKPFKWY